MKNIKLDIQRYKNLIGDESDFRFKDYLKILSPRLIPNVLFRTSYYLKKKGFKKLSKLFSLLNILIFNIEIATECDIKGGLFIPHTFGIVIGAAHIGENVTIYQNVTIGAKTLDMKYNKELRPIIGNNVILATGSVILGSIMINDGAIV
ncbi:serine acetyltransferase, partial [Proteus mirabilis]